MRKLFHCIEELCKRQDRRKALPHELVLSELDTLTKNSRLTSVLENQIRTLQRELRFQQMVFMFFQNFIFSNHDDLPEALTKIQIEAEAEADPIKEAAKDLNDIRDLLHLISGPAMEHWDLVVPKFLKTIDQEFKPDLQCFCLELLVRFLQGYSCREFDIAEFIHTILVNLKVLVISKPNMIGPIKKQIGSLEEKLEFVSIISHFAREETDHFDEKLKIFLEYIRPWVNSAAAILFVFWVDEMDEKLCAVVSSFLKKFNPNTPELVEKYLGAVKDLKPSETYEILLMRKAVSRFIDILLENLIVSTDDCFEMLREGLMFLTAFLMDPPQAYAGDEKLILTQTNLLVNEAASLICSLCLSKSREDIAEGRSSLLHDLLEKIHRAKEELRQFHVEILDLWWNNVPQMNRQGCFDFLFSCYDLREKYTRSNPGLRQLPVEIQAWGWKYVPQTNRLRCADFLFRPFLEELNIAKAELRQLHVEIPGLSWNNVPQTNRRGFFDFLLGNLKKKLEAEADLFAFEKHLIAVVHKELVSLRPFLMDIFDLQDEHEELRDIWVRASNVAYIVDCVTDSCLSVDFLIWSNLMHLSNATEQIQFVKTEVTRIRKNQMYNNRVITAKINSKPILSRQEQANATTDDVKVCFKDEEERIIDRLTGGEVDRDIVAIVGMPGQGKTTLAQRVFHDSRVRLHFNKSAWCCISQAYDIKEILLDILKSAGQPVPEKEVPSVRPEDLAERLYQGLKGERYLVVLDDIWDSKAWYELQLSFPDDHDGSRILLTSRIHDIALEAKPDCCLVELHPLSFEDSWNLLQMKVFEEDGCPPILSDIGKIIAKNCKGLPLSLVLTAGLLKDKNVDSWKQIAESLNSKIASDGCMHILELSYKHLPDFLKPCFLYFGAFREDQMIDAKKLIQLWIVEGFVQNDGMKSLEVVGSEYLKDLIARSLVFVAKRSSRYGIKKCLVHDLLHEFCLIKAKEERFLLVPNVSDHSSSVQDDHYRLCVPNKCEPFFSKDPIVPSVRSLFISDTWVNLERFILLRVLNLERNVYSLYGITQLIHLRFLSFGCHTDISFGFHIDIPPSIVNLSRLEVFRLTASNLVLPSVMMKMANLRHVFTSAGKLEYTKDDEELELFPPLTNLETFTSFCFNDALVFEKIAQKLPNVRKLGLILWHYVDLSSYFNKLESLNLHTTQAIPPSTFDLPSTLKKLSLNALHPLSRIMISSIGKLSNLEVLKLKVSFEDQRWDVEDEEFLNLKYLQLSFSDIHEWNASDVSFPCLEQLVLKECDELGELPCRLGVISTLKSIVIHNCNYNVSSSFEQIVYDQWDSGNEGLQINGVDLQRYAFDGEEKFSSNCRMRIWILCFMKKLLPIALSIIDGKQSASQFTWLIWLSFDGPWCCRSLVK